MDDARRYRSSNFNPLVLRVFLHRLTPGPDFGEHAIVWWIAMSTSTLPASRTFVTRLITSLPTLAQDDVESNPLSNAPESVKKQLLSLQVLFPNELLPALDLLDRKLITRFQIGTEEPTSNNTTDIQMHGTNDPSNQTTEFESHPAPPAHQDIHSATQTVHYVRSAQQRSSRFSTSFDSTTSYEVRLHAWNCTCPAFAFAAFPSVHPEPVVPTYVPPASGTTTTTGTTSLHDEMTQVDTMDSLASEWRFGGVSLGEGMPPVCKHLLACVLAEKGSGVFGQCVQERRVSVETAAGWAAGWGDL